MLRLSLLLILFFSTSSLGFSQTLTFPQNIDWNNAGSSGSFPNTSQYDNIFNVPSPNEISGSHAIAIQNVIDQAGLSTGVNLVTLHEGVYTITEPIILEAGLHDNVYIIGAGPNHEMGQNSTSTTLKFDFTNPDDFQLPNTSLPNSGIALIGESLYNVGTISSFNSSTNSITIYNPSTIISSDDIIKITSTTNGNFMGQINKVKSVLSTNPLIIELSHKFDLTWEQRSFHSNTPLTVQRFNALENVGLSSFSIENIGYDPDPLPERFDCQDYPAAQNCPTYDYV